MRIRIGYPERDAEREIVRGPEGARSENLGPVLSSAELLRLQEQAGQVTVDDSLVDYMLAIVEKTRSHESLALGVSPRGSQALYRAAQALALVEGREYVIPDDIKRLVVPVFAHRIAINARTSLAQRSTELSERTLQEIMTLVEVPL
jgi:MoxR-like ATPase